MEVHGDHHIQRPIVAGRRQVAEELVVGDGHRVVVESLQTHGPKPDAGHVAVLPAELDPIAHLERAIEHDHDTGHDRGHEVLEGEAQGHRRGAPHKREQPLVHFEAQEEDHEECDDVGAEAEERRGLLQRQALVRERLSEAVHDAVDKLQAEIDHDDHDHGRRYPAPPHKTGQLKDGLLHRLRLYRLGRGRSAPGQGQSHGCQGAVQQRVKGPLGPAREPMHRCPHDDLRMGSNAPVVRGAVDWSELLGGCLVDHLIPRSARHVTARQGPPYGPIPGPAHREPSITLLDDALGAQEEERILDLLERNG